VADRVLESDPEIQEPQTRYDAADGTIGGINGEGGKLHEDGILVPEHVRPGRIADGQADIHAKQDPEE